MCDNERRRVLLVDDDQDFLDQMSVRFAHEGWSVATARNEAEARALLEGPLPDLVILDLMMDRPDAGFTLAHEIKARDPRVPVLLVTGVTAETGLAFERAGAGSRSWIKADAVLAKPVRFEQIRRELDRLGVHHD